MTDEEKKAIDKINKLVEYLRKWNENVTIVPADIKYFEKILDMIKTYIRMIDENIEEILEQSKEIELLKEENEKYKNPPFFDEDEYTENDKIKAKIEEINKEMLNEENSLELFYRKKYCKEALQSLLENE